MEFFSATLTELALYVVDPNQRLYWGYLLSALLMAILLYSIQHTGWFQRNVKVGEQEQEQKPKQKNLIGFLFPKRIFFARSAINDYALFIVNKLIRAALFPLIVLTMVPVALSVSSGFEWLFGANEPLAISSFNIMVIFTALLFIFDDFTRFYLHYLLHKISFLWEFHKVHHSATVLTPFTVYRSHPIENYLYACRMALTQGFVVGLCYYLFGPTLKMLDIIGANIFVFAFNIMGSNLRHSHIWLSWGDKIEGVFLSPAQHQIHHSDNVKHFDKNFGTALSIWDRLFGCFVRASAAGSLSFGIGKEGEAHNSLIGLYLSPFINLYRKIRHAFSKAI